MFIKLILVTETKMFIELILVTETEDIEDISYWVRVQILWINSKRTTWQTYRGSDLTH